jgi:iron(III) transport system substrate-binding protein
MMICRHCGRSEAISGCGPWPAEIASSPSAPRNDSHWNERTYFIAAALFAFKLPAGAQTPERPWLDSSLLQAARSEGELVVYSSINEQEGLPLWKIFEEATGIKVFYVRASDTVLMSRVAIEFRADQKSYDAIQTTTVNKLPPQLLATFDPPQARDIAPNARDPWRRWYGVYANYNAPAYNTRLVQRSELPRSYEEFLQHKEWAGKVAIDATDNEWLKAIYEYHGEERGQKLVKDLVTTLNPVVTDGHLALARAVGAGEYAIALNNYVNLMMNVKLAGGPTDYWALDPVALFFGQVGVNAKAPHPNAARLAANFMLSKECQTFLAKFGRLPTRADVQANPPGIIEALTAKKVVTVLLGPDEEKKWQRAFDGLFRRR